MSKLLSQHNNHYLVCSEECFVVMVRYHGSFHGFSTSGVDWSSLILCKLKYVRTHVYTFFTVENIVFNNSQPLIRNKAEIICV
jgi:hypothetical protein